VHPEAEAVEAEAAAVAALPAPLASTAMRVLGTAIDAAREGPWFTRRHAALVHALAAAPAGEGSVSLPRGLAVRRLGPRLVLHRVVVPPPPPVTLSGRSGEARGGRFVARRVERPAHEFDAEAFAADRRAHGHRPPWLAAFDADRLGEPLVFRPVSEEDRFIPFGRCGETSVLELLRKRGVSGPLRRGVRVAQAPSGVAWVLGQRIDARLAVTSRTTRVALVEATVE
jgi:hypothetical protein